MNEILELQTGQVSFISGLMTGFSLTIAAQIMRSNVKGPTATACFVMFTISSLLFLVALYIDVALSLKLASIKALQPQLLEQVTFIRDVGTSSATSAFFLFITAVGALGWIQSRLTGVITSLAATVAFITLWVARDLIFNGM